MVTIKKNLGIRITIRKVKAIMTAVRGIDIKKLLPNVQDNYFKKILMFMWDSSFIPLFHVTLAVRYLNMYSYVGGLLCGNISRVSIDVGWWLSLACFLKQFFCFRKEEMMVLIQNKLLTNLVNLYIYCIVDSSKPINLY